MKKTHSKNFNIIPLHFYHETFACKENYEDLNICQTWVYLDSS